MALSDCPRAALPTSMTLGCLKDIGNVTRLAFILKEHATQPFTGADAAGVLTNIEDSAKWTTALGASTPDSVVLTPKIQDSNTPKVISATTELPNGDMVTNRVQPNVVATHTLTGLTATQQTALRSMEGGVIEFMMINELYETIFKTVASGTETPFFEAQLLLVSSRENTTSGQDNTDLVLYLGLSTLDDFQIADTTSFMKNL